MSKLFMYKWLGRVASKSLARHHVWCLHEYQRWDCRSVASFQQNSISFARLLEVMSFFDAQPAEWRQIYPIWKLCKKKAESSYHQLKECPALASVRMELQSSTTVIKELEAIYHYFRIYKVIVKNEEAILNLHSIWAGELTPRVNYALFICRKNPYNMLFILAPCHGMTNLHEVWSRSQAPPHHSKLNHLQSIISNFIIELN